MSKVIKASRIISLEDSVVIQPAKLDLGLEPVEAGAGAEDQPDPALLEAQSMRERIVSDAETSAEAILAEATAEAERIRMQAQEEIDGWWQERRQADVQESEQARRQGYDSGYQEGRGQAEDQIQAEYGGLIETARSLIEQASFIKQQMILEAEPFLIELSTAIAEKIIGKQLTLEPAWVTESIRRVLQRKREQGVISLCVAPNQFAFIQDAREELLLAIDSQAELQVLPDPSVDEFGCVVRSSFGSIDARIDTQLEEIKEALLQLYRRSEANAQDV